MATSDVTIFNVTADEPGGIDVVAQIAGVSVIAGASSPTAQEQSNSITVDVSGAAATAGSGVSTGFGNTAPPDDLRNIYFRMDFESGLINPRDSGLDDAASYRGLAETGDTFVIDDITNANPGVVTYIGNPPLTNLMGIRFSGMGAFGMTEMEDRLGRVKNLNTSAKTFDLYEDWPDGPGSANSDQTPLGRYPVDTRAYGSFLGSAQGEYFTFLVESDGTGAPGSNQDARVESSVTLEAALGGDLVTPRLGNYFLPSWIYYTKPYELFTGNSGKNKPRWLLVPPAVAQFNWDEEIWLGWSMYVPSGLEEETTASGNIAQNSFFESGPTGTSIDGNTFLLRLSRPAGAGSVSGVPGDTWTWVIKVYTSTASVSADEIGTAIDYGIGSADDDGDKGKWVDFVVRYRGNPADGSTGPINPSLIDPRGADMVLQPNQGILQVWKSFGDYDENGNRQMELRFDRENTSVGALPVEGLQLNWSLRQYYFGWHHSSHSNLNPFFIGYDQIFLGRASDGCGFSDVHASQQPEPGAPPETFQSNAKVYADRPYQLGEVPNQYSGYQMIQSVSSHLNVPDDFTCDLRPIDGNAVGNVDVIYCHLTPNNQTDQPASLSDWTDTGLTGSVQMEDRDGGNIDVPCYFYKKTYVLPLAGPVQLAWNYRSADIQDRLKHFPGPILVPPAALISNMSCELYRVVPDISAAYEGFGSDWFWQFSPSGRPATTRNANSWAAIKTELEAAAPGDVIEVAAGSYNDQGTLNISGVSGTKDNPIWLVPPETTMTGAVTSSAQFDGASTLNFNNGSTGVRVWGFHYDDAPNNNGHVSIEMSDSTRWISVENSWWDGYSSTNPDDRVNPILMRGKYNRVGNNAFSNKTCRGDTINWSPTSGDNFASQWNLIQYNHFNGFNVTLTDPSLQGASFVRLGGNNNHYARGYTIVRKNRFEDWNKTDGDAEFLVTKSCGHQIYSNSHNANANESANAGFFSRNGAWGYVYSNYSDNNFCSANTNQCTMQGVDPVGVDAIYAATDLIHARNYVENDDGTIGWIASNQVSSTSTNRYVARGGLVCDMTYANGIDQAIRLSSSSNATSPTNIHFHALSIDSSQAAVDESYQTTGLIQWEACVISSPLGMNVTPAGVTIGDPGHVDRGDGVKVSNTALNLLSYTPCVPIPLQGPTINGLGTTYTSI